ncbi:hypothetical protein [Hymenobacter sp. BRD67]|uniref:hypothetical protein n=1 Tax=Hymenobacter sp. BRD67 TaxID=2675877 RepID=UPI001567A725|nr:hypothetical protein [Hymenobacter sp. BRD67]QKG53132.1 hypothetical protein GKZ67_11655 [Hymenobacter sp. BRD67]
MLSASAAAAQAARPFTPGNFVIVRVGDGKAALTSAATAAFLLEYSPTGTLVQTIALPTADASPNLAFTETGTATSDANLTRSADGHYLLLPGYNAPWVPHGSQYCGSCHQPAHLPHCCRWDASYNHPHQGCL